jgi:hypothetical protein
MSFTVRELVSAPHLRLDVLVEGDLDHEIRWVHSSDMPDPAPYLRGGEVVLTAGIWFWHGTPASDFTAGLGRAGAAALGFGTNPLVGHVPGELVDACRAWGLTLFHVPDDVSFIEIAEEFVEVQQRLRERPLIESLDRSSRFVRALQAGRGVDGVVRLLSRVLGRRAAMVRRGGEIVASSRALSLPDGLAESFGKDGEGTPVEHGAFTVFSIPTAAHDSVLAVERRDEELTVAERATIDQAVAFLAIELQRERAVAEAERRFAGELFDLVAAGEPQHAAVAARLSAFGLDHTQPLVAVCCDSAAADTLTESAHAHLDAQNRRGVFALKGAELLGILELAAGDDAASVGKAIHAALGPDAHVGVGGVAADAHGLAVSLTEARYACRFAGRRRDGGYATHDALASHELLLALQDEHVLRVFQDTLIRPLAQHDARRHTDLVETLDSFLGSGGRYQATADRLHLHVNTLRLRLARIEELTGRDLSSMDDRVDFWIALRTRRPG